MINAAKSTKRKTKKSGDSSLSTCTSTADLTSDLSSALGKCFLSDSDGSISESDAECPICGLTFLEDDSDSPWVCCDGCQSWLDFKCTRLKTPNDYQKSTFAIAVSSCK